MKRTSRLVSPKGWLFLLFLGCFASSLAFAGNGINPKSMAYSGGHSYTPIKGRVQIYKYRALDSRLPRTDKYKNMVTSGNTNYMRFNSNTLPMLGDCSVNIGNILSNNNDKFSTKETMVIIDGDVLNVSRCD